MSREWTDEHVRLVLDLVMNTDCGYCLDGRDRGALPCPECGGVETQREEGE